MINDLQLKDNIVEKNGTIPRFIKVKMNHQIYDAIQNLRAGSRRDMRLPPFK